MKSKAGMLTRQEKAMLNELELLSGTGSQTYHGAAHIEARTTAFEPGDPFQNRALSTEPERGSGRSCPNCGFPIS
jgi:hypothetical protein